MLWGSFTSSPAVLPTEAASVPHFHFRPLYSEEQLLRAETEPIRRIQGTNLVRGPCALFDSSKRRSQLTDARLQNPHPFRRFLKNRVMRRNRALSHAASSHLDRFWSDGDFLPPVVSAVFAVIFPHSPSSLQSGPRSPLVNMTHRRSHRRWRFSRCRYHIFRGARKRKMKRRAGVLPKVCTSTGCESRLASCATRQMTYSFPTSGPLIHRARKGTRRDRCDPQRLLHATVELCSRIRTLRPVVGNGDGRSARRWTIRKHAEHAWTSAGDVRELNRLNEKWAP